MKYEILETIILRTPRFSFRRFFDSDNLNNSISDKDFEEALFIASPDLHDAYFSEYQKKDSINLSLIKYFLRATFRCTPFGMFAAVSTAGWGNETQIKFTGQKRLTRLDTECLYRIANKISATTSIQHGIKFSPNSSIWEVGGKLRYIEYNLKDNRRHYNLSAVTLTKPLRKILNHAKGGKTIKELVKQLTPDSSKREATAFIISLIENQLLVSELEPLITGDNFLDTAIFILAQKKGDPKVDALSKGLSDLKQSIIELDQKSINDTKAYRSVLKCLDTLNVTYEKNKILQVDLYNLSNLNKLSIDIKRQLHIGLQALAKLQAKNQNKRLDKFIHRYIDRYGDKEIPLLEALDSESGIGYPDPIDGDSNSLTEGIKLKQADERNVTISDIQNILFRKLQNSLIQQSQNIDIGPDELEPFNEHMNRLPVSFSIMFRVIDFKENKILIETAGAANAVKLLGRFAYGDSCIDDLAKQISKIEKANNPTKIIAEVIHIPSNRLGNILLHPPFFSHEIPYLSHSSLPAENQIPLQDIYISTLNGTIQLRSKRLNQEIIPVISHAHNTSQSELPVYQFLADLQSQKKNTRLTFSFGQIADELIFIPRVTYCKKIVLQPAAWRLEKKDWIKLTDKNKYEFVTSVKEFVSKWKLPRYVVLEEYDNELFVDFEATKTVEAFLDAIKTKDKIVLKEFLFDPNTPITDENNQPYINQFIATVAQTDPASEQTAIQEIGALNKPRTFFPGSEWLYYKYYCSAKNTDSVLTEIIKPFVSVLSKEKLIDSWFFIRYKDDHTHLRVRFHLSDKRKLSTVLSAHDKYFEKITAKELIWKIQIDTYEREIERYGNETMELSERIFHYDSESISEFLALQSKGVHDEDIRWLWGMMSIDELLNDFTYSLEQKFELLNKLSNSFHAEFDLPKASKFEIDKKYRKFKTKIDSLFGDTYLDSRFLKIIKKRSKYLSSLKKQIHNYNLSSKEVDRLMGSYIHMSLNRLLEHSHRLQEMIVYDFLTRSYKSEIVLRRKKN